MSRQVYRAYFEEKLFADQVLAARRFTERLVGLLGRDELDEGAGLLIEPGGSVHTLGMSFPIDVVFLDCMRTITGIRESLAPNRFCVAPRRTHSTLELPAGTCAKSGLRTGEMLLFEIRRG